MRDATRERLLQHYSLPLSVKKESQSDVLTAKADAFALLNSVSMLVIMLYMPK